MALEAAAYALVLLVATVLTWKGSDRLEVSAGRLATRYRLPPLVRGTLVVAVGSSFPELTTTVAAAAVHGEFELGMATVVGSAVFNILMIPAISAFAGGRLTYDIRLVYRDAQFYLTSVATLLLAFSFALIYEPVEGEELTGTMTRGIAVVPLALYGLYLFLQHQETRGVPGPGSAPPMPGPAVEASEADADAHPDAHATTALGDWLRLLLSLVLVVAGVEGLLRVALWLGETLGTPSFLWGATVVAAATSVPDALISVRVARRGDGDVSIGNVLGSNIFDLLVAIPAGILVAGAYSVDYAVAAPLMAFLTLATIVLFATMRTDVQLSRREGVVLLLLYVAFVAWIALETAGVTDALG